MDVSKYALDGEWIEITVQSDQELEPFKFKVQPMVEAGATAASKSPDAITTMFIESVIGWNFVIGTDPIPCDEANKRRYLARFATYLVAKINGHSPDEKQEKIVEQATARLEAATDTDARMLAMVEQAREKAKLRVMNMAGAVVEFASKPDNFLKN